MPDSFSNTSPISKGPHVDGHPQQVRKMRKTFSSKSSIHECRSLARKAVSFLQRFTSDPKILFELELVITEACTNVVVHGYNNDHDGYIKVQILVENDNRVLIKIFDGGKPFTGPDKKDYQLDPTQESGRGIYIISQLSDSYSYMRHDGQNILRIEKNLRNVSV